MKWVLFLGLTAVAASMAGWRFQFPGKTGSPISSAGLEGDRSGALEIQGIGYSEPLSEVRRLMPRIGGVIKRCYVNTGDSVRKGDLLLELEDATQRADVEAARKQWELAQAEAADVLAGINPYQIKVVEQTCERLREKFRHCTAEERRCQALIANRSVSAQDLEQAATQRRQAEAELKEQEAELLHLRQYVTAETRASQEAKVRHARTNLALAEARLQEYQLRAPFDGVVLKILKREGDAVWPAAPEPIVLFGDLSRVRVRAEIDERFVQQLAVGQEAVVTGRNLADRSYRGRVAVLEKIMGDKTVFAKSSSERKDLQVLQVLLDMEPDFRPPAGLQVDVAIRPE
jgi:HlyD family secretion protein